MLEPNRNHHERKDRRLAYRCHLSEIARFPFRGFRVSICRRLEAPPCPELSLRVNRADRSFASVTVFVLNDAINELPAGPDHPEFDGKVRLVPVCDKDQLHSGVKVFAVRSFPYIGYRVDCKFSIPLKATLHFGNFDWIVAQKR